MTVFHPSSDHSIWLRSQAAVFVYLPKVACTSWKLHLAAALGVQAHQEISYKTLHNPEALPLPYVARLSEPERQQFNSQQQSSDFRYFTVMRDPRERAVSAYRDKILLHANPQSFFSLQVLPSIQAHAGLADGSKPSFEQFLRWLQESPDPATQNDHWCPMTRLLGLQGHAAFPASWQCWPMASMEQAVQAINALLGFDQPFPGREALGPRPDRQSRAAMPDLITAPVEALLQQLYADDLRLYRSLTNGSAPV